MKRFISSVLSAAIAGSCFTFAMAQEGVNELVSNGGFEGGVTDPWVSFCGSNIAVSNEEVHSGSAAMKVTDRIAANSGALIDISGGSIVPGATYKISAWVKYNEGPDALSYNIIMVANNSSAAAEYKLAASAEAAKGEWTLIEASYTVPDELDTASLAQFYFETQSSSENVYYDFYVDDVSIVQTSVSDALPALAKTPGRANPLMGYDFGADPFAMEYNGRLYVYMTADSFEYDDNGELLTNTYGTIHTIKVISSEDMINWTDHGEIPVGGRALENGAATWATNSWAPSVVHKTIDGKEKFFLYFADNAAGIGVLESDSPTGPFTDPIGKPIVNAATPGAEDVVWMFDPAVFIDDDGQAYMYFGGGVPSAGETSTPEELLHPQTARVIKLGDDMISTEGEAVMIDAPAILEDSGIHKYNDTYYYSYCTNFFISDYEDTDGSTYPSGTICYMTSDDPMGPFTYVGPVLDNMNTFFAMGGNNHHAIFEYKDNYYIAYHARTLEKAMGYLDKNYRSTHINKVEFNSDGTMQPVTADYMGDPISGVTINAAERLEAETIAYARDINVERIDDAGNTMVTEIANGSWTSAANVDFGSGDLAYVSAMVKGEAGGTIDIRYGSVYGETVGTINVQPSENWYSVSTAVTPKSGVDDVYFVYKGADGQELFSVDYWQFSSEKPEDGTPVAPPQETEPAGTDKVLFTDNFDTEENEALYSSYGTDELNADDSGIMYSKLVYSYVEGWGESRGMEMDITSIVKENGLSSVGAAVNMGSFYWGTGDADLVKAKMIIEVRSEDGTVKNTYVLDEKPDSYGDLVFDSNRAEVALSGEAAITYESTDKLYLCVLNGTSYQDYDSLVITTSEGSQATEPPAQETDEPEQDTRVIVFSDDFTSDKELSRYSSYAENTLSEETASGIDYGSLVYNFALGWGSDHGMRMDITDIVSDLDSFGVNAKFGSFYWGTADSDLARAEMSIEIIGADGTVKNTIPLSSLPESYNDLIFDSSNRAEVYLSGEVADGEITATNSDKIYLCIKHGSGRHDYDDITIWTRDGSLETKKEVKIYTPYLDGSEAVVMASNTTDTAASVNVYAASSDGEKLTGVSMLTAEVPAGADKQEIRIKAAEGDTVYVWDSNQKPYIQAVKLEDQAMLTSWTTAQMEFRDEINPTTPLSGSTVRQVVKLSQTGEKMQLTLSNQYGKQPLVIDSLHFAKPLEGSMIDISTDTAVTFNGSESVTIPAGGSVVSDAVVFDAGDDGRIAVTMHIGSAPDIITGHEVSLTTTYIRNGGTVSDISMIGSETNEEWFFIASIDVMQSSDNGVIVCLGDSITDGVGASSAANTWPALLNARLDSDPETAQLSVINQGIGGNKVNGYSWGDRARWRYERDVLNQKGVKYLIILEGINDIGGRKSDTATPNDEVSSDGTVTGGIIEAYQEIINAAHAKGIKVIGATILPCGKSGYYAEGGEAMEEMRQKLNTWIRTEGNFDAVIDFDVLTADPENPLNILDEYDCGDGLHPSDAGYKAMAEYIDLGLFK